MGKGICLAFLLVSTYCSASPLPEVATVADPDEGCLVKNISYSKGEIVPDIAPCELCQCEPPNVVCSMIKCQQNNGCKIIQQPNRCCPEYKCECELNGKSYNNGEKVDNTSDPCKVCYCRGGEIMCTSITCYVRDDCAPQYIPGRCCPKYDHCPSVDSKVPARTINSSTQRSKSEMQPWLLTKGSELQTTVPSTPEEAHTAIKYPQTIKIVEILPTLPPSRPAEFTSGPRIITNGDIDSKKSEPELLLYSPTVSQDAVESEQTDASLSDTTETTETVTSSGTINLPHESQNYSPDTEWYTTVLPQDFNTSNEINDSDEFSNVTEGSGYIFLSGGMYTHPSSDETTEINETNRTIAVAGEDSSSSSESEESEESEEVEEISIPTKSEIVNSEYTTLKTSNSDDLPLESKSDDDSTTEATTDQMEKSTDTIPSLAQLKAENTTKSPVLTIPPVVNLNENVQYLRGGGNLTPESEKNAPIVHIYSPTKPDEVSEMTVVKASSDSPVDDHTQPILLTPQDLKTLAEMLIHEKIKPAPEGVQSINTEATTEPIITGIMSELSEETTLSNVEVNTVNDSATDLEINEIEVTEGSIALNLTEQEKWATNVIDKLTSTMALPLQGIEIVGDNSTASNYTEPNVTTDSPSSDNENVTEWVTTDNPLLRSEENSVAVTTELASETIPQTTGAQNSVSQRGSLRHFDDKDETEDLRRRVRITMEERKEEAPYESGSLFDERDRMLVENFFKKHLDFES